MLILMSFHTYAQKPVLGINGGINGSLYQQSRGFGGYGMIRFYHHAPKQRVQFAIGADAGFITNNFTIKYFNTKGEEQVRKIKSYIADPYLYPHLAVNYRNSDGRSYLYYGATAGYMLSYVQVFATSYDTNGQFIVDRVGNKLNTGISAGGHIGYVLNIKKNFALNAEFAVRWASLASGIRFVYFPASAGVRIKLFNDKEYKEDKTKRKYYR
jgi:hypothetical protein